MKINFRWLVVASISLLIAFAGLFFFVRSTLPLRAFLTYQIKKNIPSVQLKNLEIKDYYFLKRNQFFIESIGIDVVFQDDPIQVRAQKTEFNNIKGMFLNPQTLPILIEGIECKFKDIFVESATATLVFDKFSKDNWLLRGHQYISKMNVNKQVIKNIFFDIESDPKQLRVTNIDAKIGDGWIKGKFTLEYKDSLSYYMDIVFKGIALSQIAPVEAQLSKQIDATVEGTFKISVSMGGIENIDAQIVAPNGAHVNAKLLAFLLEYIPQSIQKEKLQQIISSGKSIFLDKFELKAQNNSENLMTTNFDLESKEFNLDINLGVDINVEGGLLPLVQTLMGKLPKTQ